MPIPASLKQRSNDHCELCTSNTSLQVYEVLPESNSVNDREIVVCEKCLAQIERKQEIDVAHWQEHIPTAMWSEIPGVQVTAWRMLSRLRNEAWASESLDMMYLDEGLLAWAKATGDHESDASVDLHRDSNGQVLENGDTVVLTKSLDVKGSTVNARLGTVVRNIRLDPNDTGYIEGKIGGQSIMIKTIYLRKQNS